MLVVKVSTATVLVVDLTAVQVAGVYLAAVVKMLLLAFVTFGLAAAAPGLDLAPVLVLLVETFAVDEGAILMS